MEWVQFESKNKELLKFSNIPSILKGKKLNNSSKKLKVSANPLDLLAENRSEKPDLKCHKYLSFEVIMKLQFSHQVKCQVDA